MKVAIAILVVVGLSSGPLACVFAICPQVHNCCPTKKSLNACPLDILSVAKAAKAAIPMAPSNTLSAVLIEAAFVNEKPLSILTDQGGLHLLHRVLRI
jgi:hypothetical protein